MNPVKPKPSLVLGDDDYVHAPAPTPAAPTPAPAAAGLDAMVTAEVDFKQAAREQKTIDDVLSYFSKYPNFRAGLMTSKHVLKLCNVIERMAFRGVDKKRVALALMEIIAGRPLLPFERELASNTIEFLHKNKLIKATLLQRVIGIAKRIFR